MAKSKQLRKRQLRIIDDLFAGELDEQAVLDKYRISRNLYNKWLADENFAEEFNRRIDWLNRQGQLIIARYAPLAAAKLVQLTDSENQETARKACLDIISVPKLTAKRPEQSAQSQHSGAQPTQQLCPETASRLLAALVEENEGDAK